ncbi:cytochrome P450 [Mycena vulgaris]|nr:cytochrome P450 [Mycena vulgaris]
MKLLSFSTAGLLAASTVAAVESRLTPEIELVQGDILKSSMAWFLSNITGCIPESTPGVGSPLLARVAILVVFAVLSTSLLIRTWRRPSLVGTVPGPASPSWIFGHMIELFFAHNYGDYEYRWQKEYGPLYRVKGCFGEDRLIVSDPLAMKHILNTPTFTRPRRILRSSNLVFGKSVVSFEGQEHRRIRTAMGAGLSTSVVRSFLPIFIDVAKKIVHEWDPSCAPGAQVTLNISEVLDRATLDIISEAGLGMPVNTVQNPDHPLARANVLSSAFVRTRTSILIENLVPYIPEFVFRQTLHLPIAAMRAVSEFRRVTRRVMAEKTDEFNAVSTDKPDMFNIIRTGRPGAAKNKITPQEIINQIPIVVVAGQDPCSVLLAWSLYGLASDPAFQTKVRAEVQTALAAAEGRKLDYDALPHLNALIKETLRVYPPNPITERCATEDSVLPLAYEITTSTGNRISELPVKKGQTVMVAMASYQRFEDLWGSDADQFKPARWIDGDPCKGLALGPYSHLMSFIAGHSGCIGWRFALLEAQAIIAELVTAFSFTLPTDGSTVRSRYWGTEEIPVTTEGLKGVMLSVRRI